MIRPVARLHHSGPPSPSRVLVGQLVGDSAKYALSRAVPGVAGFLSVLVFIRLLGEAQYGRYALALTLVNLTSAFFVGWLNQSVLRYHSRIGETGAARKAVGMGLGVATAVGSAVLIAIVATAFRDQRAYTAGSVVAMVAAFGMVNLYQFRLALWQARIRPDAALALGIVQSTGAIIIPVSLFLLVDRSATAALFGIALAYGGALIYRVGPRTAASVIRKVGHRLDARRIAILFWRYGWALSCWYAVVTMMQMSDRFLIQHYYGFAATGSYAAIYDILTRAYSVVLFPITLAAHPRIMKLWNSKRRGDALTVWKWAIAAQVLPFAVLLVIVLALRDATIRLVSPGADPSFTTVVLPLLIGGFLWQFALLAHKPLELAGRTRWMLALASLALTVHVAANYFLLPIFGVVVAAYALVASGATYALLSLLMGRAAGVFR